MQAWWDTGEIRIKTLRNIDWSPLWRDISKSNEELPVTSVCGPTLSLRLVNSHSLHFERRREPFLKFRFGSRGFVGAQCAGARCNREKKRWQDKAFLFDIDPTKSRTIIASQASLQYAH